ncbi:MULTISPECIES: non-ribosomal peptide synthetase [unclassified Mycolicibacterium]|uniref:non-ribosomal peptide synthetase n=1 Tax=unclassified Mycolicibacterium TaxID=2636767 RepID=UPI0012DE32BE|nr:MULTISPECIES: non-ribosomal peptide synthetase [unclassified Mycolicibacterium]MUL83655.1 amino acid adenylation domain-containing protein [Mycolicibacterium sp. CBMA 329]MUL90646.1 amino acid adenylation domain-containing protein [Mycolicibacterium sp. CBMA 331]MUM00615.1 amino acid adenylation domain-containing protein [Mycolicibacterium sp. CBMA 334]MUM28402.1 amino acid adenylation domain-containing protein [Mycolicibacterium sp. CBMA 295]MUM41590.1 amino acid adenylation domain-contain
MTTTETPPGVEDVLALSPLQQGLYSLAGLTEGDDRADPYVIAMAADIDGALDAGLLRACAEAMLARHPNLRASFFQGNLSRPVAVVPSAIELPWRQVPADDEQATTLESEERARRFDLGRGPLIRFLLIEKPGLRWRLVVTSHHIAIDGWSLPVFVGELIALYGAKGDVAALPSAVRPYRDYIGWLAGRDQGASRARWQGHLYGMDAPTLLSPVLAGRETQPGLPARTEVTLDEQQSAAIFEAARRRGVTVNTLFQMAWATILSVFTDRTDVVYGVTVSGRPDELAGVESMVGLFINTVPLRVRVDPRLPVGSQCLALQREAAELREHSYLSHTELRSLGGIGELYDTLLVYENFPPGGLVGSDEFDLGGAVLRPSALESLSHFPVTIAAHPTHGRLTVLVETLDGALGILDPKVLGLRVLAVVQRLLHCWDRPLREVTVTLDDEPQPAGAPAAAERDAGFPTGFHTAFSETAAVRLGSVALSWDGGELSYRELDHAADRLAAGLIRCGVGDETPVPIRLRRGPDYVVAMLAVLKAGAMIVPLDPAMPDERVAEIVRQIGAGRPAPILVDEALLASVEAEPDADYAPAPVQPGRGAYIVFTSGTTGKPKGVIGTHQALLAYAADHARQVLRPAAKRLGRPLRVAHAWSFTFDAAWQPLAALLDGHTVHIVGDQVQRDAEALVETIGRFAIDMIDTTPSMFASLRAAGLLTQVPLAVLALGGEAIDTATWQAIQAECERTWMSAHNCYGPTETTVEAVVATIADHPQPCIGRPTESTAAYVLDGWLRPVPDGVYGELYLAGGQLTRGYLGRPGETAGRFVADPFTPGARMYRTGDVVRRNPESSAIEFLGRSDDQVKIRGFRVEPGEVAATLHAHPEVRHTHVVVRQHRSGPRLIAYVVTKTPVTELRGMLTATLPRHLVPHHIVVVDEIPLTTNGKVDDAALAALGTGGRAEGAEHPATETERVLAQVLAEVLGTPDGAAVDVTADFLDLGLDSIVALSVVQAVRRRGVALRARLMLDCATVRELGTAIDSDAAAVERAEEAADEAAPETSPIPLLPNGRWLYQYGDPRRIAQTEVFRLPAAITGQQLETLLHNVIDGHEVLRTRLDRESLTLVAHPPREVLSEATASGDIKAAVAEQADLSVQRMDPQNGSMLDAVWLHHPQVGGGLLILTAHVLAFDPASWRIVVGELENAWHALASGRTPMPVREHTSLRQWSRLLSERAAKLDTCEFWARQFDGDDPDIGARRIDPAVDRMADVAIEMAFAEPDVTARLLTGAVPVTEVLAAATARALTNWRRHRGQPTPPPLLALETHGRSDAVVSEHDEVDTGDTAGLLSMIYPLRLTADDARGVVAQVAAIPGDAIDYGLLRYLREDTAERLGSRLDPQILLNYLGRIELDAADHALLQDRSLQTGMTRVPEPNVAVRHELTIMAAVIDRDGSAVLGTQWRTLPDILSADEIATLQAMWQDALQEVLQEETA